MPLKTLSLAQNVVTVAASTAIQPAGTPFEPGYGATCLVAIQPLATASNQVGNIEGSDDGVSYSTLAAYDAANAPSFVEVVLKPYMRVDNTSGTTGGTNFSLLGS